MRKRDAFIRITVAALTAAVTLIACDNNNGNGPSPDSDKPVLSDPTPSNGATGVDFLTAEVSWKCTNPNNEALTYDVYFGKDAATDRIGEGLTETKCALPALDKSTKYVWMVRVHYGENLIEVGADWTFTTSGDEGCGWHSEVIKEADCACPEISIDQNNRPNVVYREIPAPYNYPLKYAVRDNGTWATETITTSTGGDEVAFCLDKNGNPHIVYLDGYQYDYVLKYAYKSNGTWVTETIEDNLGPASGGRSSAMAVDGSNCVHVAYTYEEGPGLNCLMYAKRNGSSWDKETVLNEYVGGLGLSVDSSNKPYIAYSISTGTYTAEVDIVNKSGSTWTKEKVGEGSGWSAGGHGHFVIEDRGDMHILFYVDGSTLTYGKKVNGTWDFETVGSIGGSHMHVGGGLTIDSYGYGHTVFHNSDSNSLNYACKNGAGWYTTVLASGLNWAASSITVDGYRRPHVSYSTYLNGNYYLYYAWYGPSSSSQQKQRKPGFKRPSPPAVPAIPEGPSSDDAKRRLAEFVKKKLSLK